MHKITTAGLERQLDLLYKIVNTFGVFRRGSINCYNVFSICLVFLTKFNGCVSFSNLESIKNINYKILAHSQR